MFNRKCQQKVKTKPLSECYQEVFLKKLPRNKLLGMKKRIYKGGVNSVIWDVPRSRKGFAEALKDGFGLCYAMLC